VYDVLKSGLRFLIRICTDLSMKDAAEYSAKLSKAEKSSTRANSALQREASLTSSGERASPKEKDAFAAFQSGMETQIKKQVTVTKNAMEDVSFDDDVTGLLPE
jgi:hypothetical protein